MIFKLLNCVLVLNFIICVATVDDELKFVTVVFRHGDRTPVKDETYPNDPYLHDDYYPLGNAQLTVKGKQREYQLGKILHTLYNNFLGDIYVPKDLVALSTGTTRTRMSLQLVAAALYPPKGPQVWNESLNWQPILTSYVPEEKDIFLKPFICSEYLEEFRKVNELPDVKSEMERFRPLMRNISAVTGKEITTPYQLFLLSNGLIALEGLGRPLPKWSEGLFPEGPLVDAVNFEYKIIFYNDKLKKLRSGRLLRNITDTMKDIVEGKSNYHPKMNLFSGHDQTVVALLAVLSDYVPHVPKFSSSVMVELLHRNNNYFVKARYYLGIPATVVDLKIPGCDVLCPFNEFMAITKKFIASDEEMSCTIKV